MNNIKFSDEVPTEPGAYLWRKQDRLEPWMVELGIEFCGSQLVAQSPSQYFGTPPDVMKGQWCKLLPASCVEEVAREFFNIGRTALYSDKFEDWWNQSNARKLTEGTSPTSSTASMCQDDIDELNFRLNQIHGESV